MLTAAIMAAGDLAEAAWDPVLVWAAPGKAAVVGERDSAELARAPALVMAPADNTLAGEAAMAAVAVRDLALNLRAAATDVTAPGKAAMAAAFRDTAPNMAVDAKPVVSAAGPGLAQPKDLAAPSAHKAGRPAAHHARLAAPPARQNIRSDAPASFALFRDCSPSLLFTASVRRLPLPGGQRQCLYPPGSARLPRGLNRHEF